MPIYHYTRILPAENACFISSTDSGLLTSLSNELSSAFPEALVEYQSLPSNELYHLAAQFWKLKPKDAAEQASLCFETWLRYLCSRGWEPFAVHAAGEYASSTNYHFRMLR